MEELRVVITADASGVGPGVAEATAQVQASADSIAAAQTKATAATKQLTAAQLQLGAAAEAGNAQAAGIIAEYAAANSAAQAELQSLTAAQVENTAATVADTAAQSADTKVIYNRIEAMGSARVAMGAMSGSMGTMGMGLARIAAGSQLVGPLLAEMVPLAIMAAGVLLAYDLGEAIYKAFDLGGEAELGYQKALDGIDESTRTLIDSTALEADKLEAANLKLEHLPNPNAQKEAIDEALVDADKMASKLDAIIDKEEKLLTMQGAAGSGLQRFFTNEQAPRQEGVDLAEHARWLEQATTLEGQLGESKSFVANEQARVNELTQKQVELDAIRNTSTQANVAMWAIGVSEFDKEISSLNEIIAQENKVTDALRDQITVRDEQKRQLELQNEAIAAQQELENLRTHLAIKEETTGKSATAEYLFWKNELHAFKEGSSEYLDVLRAFNTAKAELEKQFSEPGKIKTRAAAQMRQQVQESGQAEAGQAKIRELESQLVQPPKGEAEAAGRSELDALDLEHQKLVENLNLRRAEADIKFQSKLDPSLKDRINQQIEIARMDQQQFQIEASYLEQKKALIERTTQAEIDEAQKAAQVQQTTLNFQTDAQLEALEKEYDAAHGNMEEQARITAEETAISQRAQQQQLEGAIKLRDETVRLKRKEVQDLAQLDRQEEQNSAQAHQKMIQDAQKEAQQFEQTYKRVATTFNADFEQAFNKWAQKSQTAGQAFGQMLGTMELQVIDFVAKWLLQQAEKWALTKVLDATGFATQRATQAAANVGMIASDAAVAAAGTMAFYSAIDPVTAPAMAAVAYAETMAYAGGAVMDTGGMMPHMGFAMNTSGSPERVLSPSQTSNFESLVNNGGSRSATLNQTNNFGGGVTKDMLDAHTSKTMSQLRAMIRPEALNA